MSWFAIRQRVKERPYVTTIINPSEQAM